MPAAPETDELPACLAVLNSPEEFVKDFLRGLTPEKRQQYREAARAKLREEAKAAKAAREEKRRKLLLQPRRTSDRLKNKLRPTSSIHV